MSAKALTVEFGIGDEHHMGAQTIYLLPSVPVRGIAKFKTTNGDGLATDSPPRLVLWDATVILIFDPVADDLRHVRSPADWYFTQLRVDGRHLHGQLRHRREPRRAMEPIDLHELAALPEGSGPVERGEFPSAYP